MPDLQRYTSKLCLINYELDIYVDKFENWLFSLFIYTSEVHFCCRKTYMNYQSTTVSTINPREKRQYSSHYWSDKGFKGTLVNRTLPSMYWWSLVITLTATLMLALIHKLISGQKFLNISIFQGCGRRFKRHVTLRQHIDSVHNKLYSTVYCNFCTAQFKSRSGIV